MRGPAAADEGVLDRVDVDRAAVRVLRPALRALDVAAVERGGVVRLDRAKVAGPVDVDRHHAPDREAGLVEPAHHRQHRAGNVSVDDEPAGMHPAVEAPVTRRDDPELVEPDRAAWTPGDPCHLLPERSANRVDPPIEGARIASRHSFTWQGGWHEHDCDADRDDPGG